MGRIFDPVVAVTAIETEFSGMERVAVGDGLHRHVAGVEGLGRPAEIDQHDNVDRDHPSHRARQFHEIVEPGRENMSVGLNREIGIAVAVGIYFSIGHVTELLDFQRRVGFRHGFGKTLVQARARPMR